MNSSNTKLHTFTVIGLGHIGNDEPRLVLLHMLLAANENEAREYGRVETKAALALLHVQARGAPSDDEGGGVDGWDPWDDVKLGEDVVVIDHGEVLELECEGLQKAANYFERRREFERESRIPPLTRPD